MKKVLLSCAIVWCAENEFDLRRGGGPQAKTDAAVGADFGAKRHRVRMPHAGLRNCISSATDRPCKGWTSPPPRPSGAGAES